MLAMSKFEMVQYLKDYANLCNMMIHNQSKKPYNLFASYMIRNGRYEDNNEDYYNRMVSTYTFYTYLKKFSVLEDFLLNRDDFLNNDDLADLRDGIGSITAPANTSDKKIVQLIRNAFNHNNDPDIERFRFSQSVKRFEVDLQDIRTSSEIANNAPIKPFNVTFNQEYLVKLYNLISEKSRNVMIVAYDISDDFDYNSNTLKSDLSKIKVIKYYITSKLSQDVIDKLNQFREKTHEPNVDIKKINKEFHEYVSTLAKPVVYDLTDEQINTLASMIIAMRSNSNEWYLKIAGLHAIYCMLNKVIPVPLLKKEESQEQLIMGSFIISGKLSYSAILTYLRDIINGNDLNLPDGFEKNLFYKIKSSMDRGQLIDLYYDMLDGRFFQCMPAISYIDAIVTQCYYGDSININGLKYNKDMVRNSFAHRRWFIDHDNKIVLYDADPRNIKDYDLTLVGKIDINEFIGWANTYLKEFEIKENSKKR